MYFKAFAAETGGSSSAATDLSTEFIALRADVYGLADSVRRLVRDAPELARDNFESSIRRNPLRAAFIAAGVGFVLSLFIGR